MRAFTRARIAAAVIITGSFTVTLTSCTPTSVPTTWDQSHATLAVGKASQNLQLWLQFGSPNTATFLHANSKQLTAWQDSGSLQIVYHPLAVPGSTPAEQAYTRVAGSALAAIAASQPDKVVDAMVALGDTVVVNGQPPTEVVVQGNLKDAGISIDVTKAVDKYGQAIQAASAKNRQTGPVRAEPTAILNGTFVNTGQSFITDVTSALNHNTPTPQDK